MTKIFRNAMKTPDGTIIESFHRHDYVTHKDANGQTYMVDGGTAYLRRSTNPNNPAEDLSVYEVEGDHELNRQYFRWGTYGVNGDEPIKYLFLMDMDTDHIELILETQFQISNDVRSLFEEELKYRVEKSK